jgi:UDP-glucuronate decarboxylase
MLEFADLVIEFTKAHVSIKYESLPVDDPKRRKPDINLARTKLNWQPTVKLRDGLKPTVEWFKSII